MDLLQKLVAAGLTVRGNTDWKTRTAKSQGMFDRPETVALAVHWDAIRSTPANSYYTTTNQYGGLIYHAVIRRDGSVDLLGQRIAWNVGQVARSAIDSYRKGITPPTRPPGADNMSGNPYTFAVCLNYHPDYEGLDQRQYAGLVKVLAVLAPHLDLTVAQIGDHRSFTRRKRDVDTIGFTQLRAEVQAIIEPPAPPPPPPPPPPSEEEYMWAKYLSKPQWELLYDRGIAKATSKEFLIQYWVDERDLRSDREWGEASANMFVALAQKDGGDMFGSVVRLTKP